MLLLMSFIFWAKSPTFFANPGDTSVDTAVFQTVGYMMKQGYLPYKDTFDHKGPLLYVFHYIGSLINTNWGIGFFQIINFYMTFYFSYKIARFKLESIDSLLVISLASIILLNNHHEPANVEEFSMAFVAISVYIFLEYLLNDKTTHLKVFVAGLCCAAVFMIKMSQISCWLIFGICIFALLCSKKKYRELWTFVGVFTAGFLSLCLVIVIWLLAKGCLYDAVYEYIIFNFKYIQTRRELLTSIGYWMEYDLVLVSIVAIIAFARKSQTNIIYAIYLISSYAFIAFLEDTSSHHGLTLFPAVIYPLTLLMLELKKNENIKKLVVIVILAYFVIPKWYEMIKPIPYKLVHYGENSLPKEIDEICNVIKENTTPEDKISVYGNWDVIYLFSDRVHATKYSFQNPIQDCDDKIKDEYYSQLAEEKPTIIVLEGKNWGNYEGEMKEFLDRENYELLYSQNEEITSPKVFIRR